MSKVNKATMPCNKPRASRSGGKAFVVKACQGGKEKIVRFGAASGYGRNYSPSARKNFRSRHGCDTPAAKNKLEAKHWSCKKWTAKAPVKRKPR